MSAQQPTQDGIAASPVPRGTAIVTPMSGTDNTEWNVARLSPFQMKHLKSSAPATLVAQLPDGSQLPCTQQVPIDLLRAYMPPIQRLVASATYPINTFIVPMESVDGLAKIVGYVIEHPVKIRGSTVQPESYGMVYSAPIYTYWRIAQAAQALGMRPIQREMTGRIGAILLTERQSTIMKRRGEMWTVQMADIRGILDNIGEPDQWVRAKLVWSIAVASLDKILQNEEYIKKVINKKYPEVAEKIKKLQKEIAEIRG